MSSASEKPRYPVLAGALAGSLEIVVTYPIEYVKTQLQLQVASSALYAAETRYTGTVDCLVRTMRCHGVLGLYQGGSSWLVAAGPRAAVRFGAFEALAHSQAGVAMREQYGRPASDFVNGLLSGALEAALVQTPNQAIQVKMVHDQSPQGPHRYRSLLHATREIYNEFGVWRGFMGGLSPTVVKVSLCNAIRFAGFGSISEKLRARPERMGGASAPLSPLETMSAGGLAGAISAVVSQPIDVVRANMMGLDAKRYSSSLQCALAIWRDGGIGALFLGLAPRVGRVFVEIGLTFTLFEQISRSLNRRLP